MALNGLASNQGIASGYDPNSVFNEVLQMVGRDLNPQEVQALVSQVGYTGGMVTPEQRNIALGLAQQNKSIDPNSLNNEITGMLGREANTGELDFLRNKLGNTLGSSITQNNRIDSLNMVQQYMHGLPITSQFNNQDLSQLAQQKFNNINEKVNQNLNPDAKQSSVEIINKDNGVEDIRKKFNEQAFNDQLNPKRFNFRTTNSVNSPTAPVSQTGIPYQGGRVNMNQGRFF